MKNLFLLALGICLSSSLCLAQSSKSEKILHKTAKKIAKTMCKCLQDDLKEVDPNVLDMIVKMFELESKEAGSGEKYIMGLEAADQLKLIGGLSDLEHLGENMDDCFDQSGLEVLLGEAEKNGISDEDAILKLAVDKMGNIKKCKAAHALMQFGMMEEVGVGGDGT